MQCIHKLTPYSIINDRIGHKKEREDLNYLGNSDYRVYDDRFIPKQTPKIGIFLYKDFTIFKQFPD